MRTAAPLLIAVCTIASLAAQQPQPRDTDKQTHVRGRIVTAENGRPLARARVSLFSSATPARPLMTASTNSQGNYDLRDVPPGKYFVSASRAGYLELQYGQRRARERGLSVDVKPGETVGRIDIALVKGGVVAGRVVDETGEPYPDAMIMVWQLQYQEGRRVPYPSGNGKTDDQGVYRISGLQPGSYTVSALASETWRNEKGETLGYTATYYPGTSAEQAQSIVLDTGQQRLTLDFTLAAARTARLRGRVLRPTGEPASAVAVSASPSIRGAAFSTGNAISTTTDADGSFEIRDVPPGFYLLRGSNVGRDETAGASVDVSGDVDNLLLALRTGSTITGVVVTDTGEPPPFSASGARLSLVAPEPGTVLPTIRVPAVNADWTFTLRDVGGPFLFRLAAGFPTGWMLDAVRLNEDDFTDVPFDVPTGNKQIAGLRVVITKEVGKIAGTMMTTKGTPTADAIVVVFPEDEHQRMFGSRFVKMARPTAEGAYSISGLPAGDYLIVAEPELMDGEWENREYLKSAEARAAKVTLKRGESASVDLKVAR